MAKETEEKKDVKKDESVKDTKKQDKPDKQIHLDE